MMGGSDSICCPFLLLVFVLLLVVVVIVVVVVVVVVVLVLVLVLGDIIIMMGALMPAPVSIKFISSPRNKDVRYVQIALDKLPPDKMNWNFENELDNKNSFQLAELDCDL